MRTAHKSYLSWKSQIPNGLTTHPWNFWACFLPKSSNHNSVCYLAVKLPIAYPPHLNISVHLLKVIGWASKGGTKTISDEYAHVPFFKWAYLLLMHTLIHHNGIRVMEWGSIEDQNGKCSKKGAVAPHYTLLIHLCKSGDSTHFPSNYRFLDCFPFCSWGPVSGCTRASGILEKVQGFSPFVGTNPL